MIFVRTLLGFVITALLAVFAVLNRAPVDIVWSPFHPSLSIPLYLICLGLMGAGFFMGGIAVWFSGGKARREKRRQKRQIRKLEKELEIVQEQEGLAETSGSDFFPALPLK